MARGEPSGVGGMDKLFNAAEFNIRYGKRLAIVVPFRNRPRHLSAFMNRITSYFRRDKLDKHVMVSVHVVEQYGSGIFNRGKLKNIGFAIAKETTDYVCFHDVDYLPIWADYSWSPTSARLIWHGLRAREDPERFFGGVVLFDNAAFQKINGYPNSYWGWGFEDAELRIRTEHMLGPFEKRDGTYLALPHKSEGVLAPGLMSQDGIRNGAYFRTRQPDIERWMARDGLSSLKYKMVDRVQMRLNGKIVPGAFRHVVDIGEPETKP
jgi:hypothetical protein